MSEKPKKFKANTINGMIIGDVGRVKQNYGSGMHDESGNRVTAGEGVPKYVWVTALVCMVGLILFMMAAFFLTPAMTQDQRNLIYLLFSLLAGFSTLFMGGSVLMKLDWPAGGKGKMAISATAGVAVFIFVWIRAPFWF